MSTRANVDMDEGTASDPPVGPSRLPDHNGRLAVFDLDRTLLPGSSLGLFGRTLNRAGMVGSSRATAYSDSISELPLLTAAGRPVAVNPDRRLRREARLQAWPVLTF
jgi:phosphoserine phosphatase